ncbi:RNA-binding protein 33-like isoform X2 [Hetaerina americana]|uniref:RNA-binding protein 33-like isoform X2 n=1 Tax=Hetaerina americana TaxID=62018 RepID=UPI003A7F370F
MGQNRSGGHQGGMGYAHGRGEGPMDSMRDAIGPTPSQFMLSQNIHFNPHFKGNILPQPEGPSWNEGHMVNQPPPSGSVGPPPHTPFHSLPRFPPPPVGGYAGVGGEHHGGGDMLSSFGDHQRQPRQRSPPPLHSAYQQGPGVRAGGYDSPPNHPDFHRDEPYDNRRPPHPGDVWNSSSQRMQEGPIGLPSGGGPHHNHHHHHHQQQQHQQHQQQYGGGHFPMSPGAPHHHGERGGETLQHFRPTMQPGPLFSHVAAPPSVAPPMGGIPNQPGLMVHQPQHHLHNVLRSAPPMHGGSGGGMGQHLMQQIPPQEQPHSRIPPPGFSPNEGRSIPSVHHGMSPWHDPPINRSPMGGQHMSVQQHSAFHHDGGAPRPFLGERPGTIQGAAMHHHASVAAMSAPPPPFHSSNIPQGPHPPQSHHVPPMQHSPMRQNSFNNSPPVGNEAGNSGGHNNGRFPRQGNFQQQQGYSRAPPSHQGLRPNRGSGHMSQGRGGLGSRRGMGTPNSRPQMVAPKAAGEDQFPPKRTNLQDGSSGSLPAMKVSPPKKRKVRKIVKNNLLEVETVDTLPDTTTTGDKEATARDDSSAKPAEPVDAEILKYQKMIEEQKQLREEVLRRKEQRRKLMALQKQRELQEKAAGEASGEVPKGNAIATIVNRNPVEPSTSVVQAVPIMQKEPMANQNFIPPLNPGQQPHPNVPSNQAQLLAARRKALIALKAARGQNPAQMPVGRGMAIRGMRGGMANQQLRSNNLVTLGSAPGAAAVQQVPIRPGGAGRGTVLGRGQSVEGSPQPGRPTAQGRGQGVVSKQGQQVQPPGGQRLVQMLPPQQQNNVQNQDAKVQANKLQRVVKVNVPTPSQPQPQTRKVVVQGVGGAGDCIAPEGGVASGSVVVENLAMSTTEGDLKKMCSTVGRVKSIRMVPGMRSAWVEFAHPTSAATFCQRYQRKIVDLSMITVRLANS